MCWSWQVSLSFSMFEFIIIGYLLNRNKYIDLYWVLFITPIALQEFLQFITWSWGIDENSSKYSCNEINFFVSRITLIITHPLPVLCNFMMYKTLWKGTKKWIKKLWKFSLIYHIAMCILLICAELIDNNACIFVGKYGHLDWFNIHHYTIQNNIDPPYLWIYLGVIALYWTLPQILG